MADTVETQLKYDVDDRGVRQFVDRLGELEDSLQDIHGGLNDIGEDGSKNLQQVQASLADILAENKSIVKDLDGPKSFGKAFEGYLDNVDDLNDKVAKLGEIGEKQAKALAKGQEDLAHKLEQEYSKTFNSIGAEQQKLVKKMSSQQETLSEAFIGGREDLAKFFEEELPQKTGEGIGKSIKGAIDADPQAMVMGLTGALTTGMKGAAKKAQQFMKEREATKSLGPDGSPVAGKGKGGKGGIAKALGGIAKVLGPLAAAAGGFAMIVKLLMDAESQTIELNETLLESVSLMSLGAGNMEKGVERMDALRSAATDFRTQIRLGMDPQEFMGVVGALESQSVSLDGLIDQYGDTEQAATTAVESIRMASLGLAADTKEVTDFVVDLMDIQGLKFDEVQHNLDLVVGAANRAGIATQEFFGTVSQITGQMGLYNFRLEDTTFLMGQMSNLMDADTAQEFTKQFATGMKDMNAEERLRLKYLAGQHTVQEMLTDEVGRRFETIVDSQDSMQELGSIIEDVTGESVEIESGDDLEETVMNMARSGEDLDHVLSRLQNENSDLADRVRDASRMAQQVEKGGLATADAMAELQAMDHLELEMKQLENVFDRPISEISALEADKLGVDEQQLRVMQNLDQNSRGQLSQIQAVEEAFARGDVEANDELKELNERLGLSLEVDEETNELITEEGETLDSRHDLMRQMSEEEMEEVHKNTMSQEEAAREQVSATQSVADILRTLIAPLLEMVSTAVMGVSKMILQIPGVRDDTVIKRMEMQERQMEIQQEQKDLEDKRAQAARDGDEALLEQLEREQDILEREDYEIEDLLDSDEVDGLDSIRRSATRTVGQQRSHDQQNEARRQEAASFQDQFGLGKSAAQSQVNEAREQELEKRAQKLVDEEGLSEGDAMQKAFDERGDSGLFSDDIEEAYGKVVEDTEELLEESFESSENQEEFLENIDKTVGEDTVIDSNTLKEMAKEYADEMSKRQREEKAIDEIEKATGLSRAEARSVMHGGGDMETLQRMSDSGSYSQTFDPEKVADIRRDHDFDVREAGDAKILSGGVAPFSFEPGDMVVKKDMIADAIPGKAGEFVPDLLQAMGGGGSSGGGRGRGGGSISMRNTFNINGGNIDEVENTLLKVLDMAERKRYGES